MSTINITRVRAKKKITQARVEETPKTGYERPGYHICDSRLD